MTPEPTPTLAELAERMGEIVDRHNRTVSDPWIQRQCECPDCPTLRDFLRYADQIKRFEGPAREAFEEGEHIMRGGRGNPYDHDRAPFIISPPDIADAHVDEYEVSQESHYRGGAA